MNPEPSTLGPKNPVKAGNSVNHWLSLYETHLFQSAAPSTYERYCRILDKFFFDHFPQKRSPIEFLRKDFEDYTKDRLKEGVSPTTVGIELSVIRGFWKFLVRMDAAFFNPVVSVKVENPKRKKRSLEFPDLVPKQPGATYPVRVDRD